MYVCICVCRCRYIYKVVQIWPRLFVCKQVTVCPGHIWTTLYIYIMEDRLYFIVKGSLFMGGFKCLSPRRTFIFNLCFYDSISTKNQHVSEYIWPRFNEVNAESPQLDVLCLQLLHWFPEITYVLDIQALLRSSLSCCCNSIYFDVHFACTSKMAGCALDGVTRFSDSFCGSLLTCLILNRISRYAIKGQQIMP
jgi:hypothetical protein